MSVGVRDGGPVAANVGPPAASSRRSRTSGSFISFVVECSSFWFQRRPHCYNNFFCAFYGCFFLVELNFFPPDGCFFIYFNKGIKITKFL